MALGCIPSHTSYFLAYENLKLFFGYENEDFDLKTTLLIGATTTFAHDFFITPSDGKLCNYISHQAKSLTVLRFNCKRVR